MHTHTHTEQIFSGGEQQLRVFQDCMYMQSDKDGTHKADISRMVLLHSDPLLFLITFIDIQR
jgi:hypothetical protein